MVSEAIELRFASPVRFVRLRELNGHDEKSVCGTGTADAVRLIDAVVNFDPTPTTPRLSAADLVSADRDRVLAAVFERVYGDRIESTLTCARCSHTFDLHFSLRQLAISLDSRNESNACRALGNAWFETPAAGRFRLPTGNDELAISGLMPNEAESVLRTRCTENDVWLKEPDAFGDLLEKVAPLMNLELSASCAECGHPHTIQFDIQSYLLSAILGERSRLLSEVHRLASAYSWSLDEILSLTRTERRHLVGFVENENARRWRVTR